MSIKPMQTVATVKAAVKTEAVARLKTHATTYKTMVDQYIGSVNPKMENPLFRKIANDVEPSLMVLGLKFQTGLAKLNLPTWHDTSAPAGLEKQVEEALTAKGFKFEPLKLNPTVDYAKISHFQMPRYGNALITCTIRRWVRGSVTVTLNLGY